MRNQKGFTLIEVLVAMAILGIVSVGFLSAMTTSTRAAISTDRMDTGRAIALSQMEYIKTLPFSATGEYSINEDIMSQYPGYSVPSPEVTSISGRDALIQKITVSVICNGNTVSALEDWKVKR
jgi:prepilin-type N-terminal cleavage/methylation domain-containing protein